MHTEVKAVIVITALSVAVIWYAVHNAAPIIEQAQHRLEGVQGNGR